MTSFRFPKYRGLSFEELQPLAEEFYASRPDLEELSLDEFLWEHDEHLSIPEKVWIIGFVEYWLEMF